MKIEYSESFKKVYSKIKDKNLRRKIYKQLQKLVENPEAGKPLRNKWKNHRTIRVEPYRIIYRIENDIIFVNCFDNRNKIYD